MTRIARKPLLVLLSVSIAVLFCLSSGTYRHLDKISSRNLFLHLLFNSIVLVIVAKEHFGEYSSNELEKGFPLLYFAYEMEEHGGKMSNDDEDGGCIDDLEGNDQAHDDGCDDDNDDDDDDDDDEDDYDHGLDGYDDDDEDDYDHGLDGYDEDDDDNGSYVEMGWWEDDEEEEYDSELEMRVEAFIAKVINGWREEWFSDNMQG